MSSKPTSTRKTPKIGKLLPDRIARLLGDRPTTAFEDDDDFDLIHAEMILAFNPQDVQDHFLVKDIADAQWQAMRLRETLSTAIELKLPEASQNLMAQDFMRSFGCNLPLAQNSLRLMSRKALRGDAKQLRILETYMFSSGVSHRDLKTEALSLALPTISAITDLINSAENRRDKAIRRIEKRRSHMAAMSPSRPKIAKGVIDVPVATSNLKKQDPEPDVAGGDDPDEVATHLDAEPDEEAS